MNEQDYSTNVPMKTLKDLKDFLNTKPDAQLDQPIRFWGEGKAGKLTSLDELHDDFVDVSGEGCEPIAVYANEEGDEFDREDYESEICYEKGSILLWTE